MRYAIATWCYREKDVSLLDLVVELAGMGFDGVSFLPAQILELDDAGARELSAVMDERDLCATVHGTFAMTHRDAVRIIEVLGARLYAMTFDAAKTQSSIGTLFDAKKMAGLLSELDRESRGTALLFGVEDFPLDAAALDHYRKDLEPILDCERYGMLIDVGHLNIRTKTHDYFGEKGPEEYLRGAARRIIEVHVHDNDGKRDSHSALGSGNADFEAAAKGLRAVGFDGVSTIEICPALHSSTPTEAKPKARQGLEIWRRLWEGPG